MSIFHPQFTSITVLALELTPLTAGVTHDPLLPGDMGYACLFSIGGYVPYKKWVAYISLFRTAGEQSFPLAYSR